MTDSSGYGHHGTISSASWVDGVDGNALSFNGTSDYVDMDPAALDMITTQVTFAFWQYGGETCDNGVHHYLLGTLSNGGSVTNMYRVLYVTSGDAVQWVAGSENIALAPTSESEYKGQWNHWTMTKDTVSAEMKIYLNGALFHSGVDKDNTLTAVEEFKLGCSGDGANFYDGAIDDLRVYNKVLSVAEVQDLAGVSIL